MVSKIAKLSVKKLTVIDQWRLAHFEEALNDGNNVGDRSSSLFVGMISKDTKL